MRKNRNATWILTALFIVNLLFLSSCQFEEGEGGLGTIKGKVYVMDYDATYQIYRGEYWGAKEDVFIVYGDDEIYGDAMEANYDGAFRFDFLRKGHYTLYAYSEDSSKNDSSGLVLGNRVPVIVEAEITDRKQVVDVGTITIIK